MRLPTQVATQIIIKCLLQVNGGNTGPEPTRGSVVAIANTPNLGDLSGATNDDIANVLGLQLQDFTAGDCDAANSIWGELWQCVLDSLQRYWDSVHANDPTHDAFPSSNFTQPTAQCDITIVQFGALLQLDWGS